MNREKLGVYDCNFERTNIVIVADFFSFMNSGKNLGSVG